MIDLTKNFEDMKNEIKANYEIAKETLSPRTNPPIFVGFDGLDYLSENNIKIKDARCLSEKYVKEKLGLLAKGNSFTDCFRELQYNAFMHGNKWDKNLPISLQIYAGDFGLVSQIIDSGKGFDYKKLVKDIQFNNKGSGFRKFREKDSCVVSWEGKGNITNLMMKVSKNDYSLWSNWIYLEKSKK